MIVVAWWGLGGAIAGLIAGSFIATLIVRWPKRRSLRGRSACDACSRSLRVRDLIPIVSWGLARGRCRACGSPIDWRHPAIEGVAALIGTVAMSAYPGWEGAANALFGWQLIALAALDFEHFWLPDRLTASLAATGLAFGAGGIGVDLRSRLIGGVAGFAALWLIGAGYRRIRGRVGLGGGDPKLLGAIGCWLGWQSLPLVLVAASVIGLLAVLSMAMRGAQVAADTRLPLGTLMALSAWPLSLVLAQF